MIGGPRLALGSAGVAVRDLQRIFVMLKSADVRSITGNFDVDTNLHVVDFQREFDIMANGVVDVDT